jgi:tRNA1(Val) A37 N6-methylase TrmN6
MMNIGFNTLPNQQINTIADIGANVGFFAIAATIAFPHAEIHWSNRMRIIYATLTTKRNRLG